ncbi:myosin-8-like [Cottoperca gobio]|uniref:Myosin-8-like n=1 Tax=Cottoperca gobio TaxID=56716 RepID=A0A6J2RNN1_COTGO|nr:myosin-8-like [Cottoperca gobio]
MSHPSLTNREANEKNSDLNNQLTVSGRRKLEVDLQTLQQEHEELQRELRGSTDKSKKASCELARVGEELRLEQEHTIHLERVKKCLEAQIKDMSSRLDEDEQMALKGGKKIIQKLIIKCFACRLADRPDKALIHAFY